MRIEKRKPDEKKPYDKPAIRRVELQPEESLVAGCKTASSGGSMVSSCTLPTPCFDPGS